MVSIDPVLVYALFGALLVKLLFWGVFAWCAVKIAAEFDEPERRKVRKPRAAKASRRDDEV